MYGYNAENALRMRKMDIEFYAMEGSSTDYSGSSDDQDR